MRYPLIDVLRALAALLVLVFHVTALGQWPVFAELMWGLPLRQGWIGVDLFLGACQKFCAEGITFHQRSIHASLFKDSSSERQSGPQLRFRYGKLLSIGCPS